MIKLPYVSFAVPNATESSKGAITTMLVGGVNKSSTRRRIVIQSPSMLYKLHKCFFDATELCMQCGATDIKPEKLQGNIHLVTLIKSADEVSILLDITLAISDSTKEVTEFFENQNIFNPDTMLTRLQRSGKLHMKITNTYLEKIAKKYPEKPEVICDAISYDMHNLYVETMNEIYAEMKKKADIITGVSAPGNTNFH